MFDAMMTDRVTIRTKEGSIYSDIPASVQTGKIFVQRVDIPIQPGDEIVRRTPAGIDEVFVVEDPGFQAAFHGIPATYQMRVRRGGAGASSRKAGTVVYNITGPNARFNINSVDSSTNVVNQAPADFFHALREAIGSQISVHRERDELLATTAGLEADLGRASFGQRYAEFMALAANHMEVLGPFVPALTQLLTGWLKGA